MSPIEIAKVYMSSFFGEKPFEDMDSVLAEDLEFIGPFYQFHSSKEYIQSLRDNPPDGVSYEILQEYENENSCCLVYQFRKTGAETVMAQLFEIKGNRISKIRLVFDASKFLKQ